MPERAHRNFLYRSRRADLSDRTRVLFKSHPEFVVPIGSGDEVQVRNIGWVRRGRETRHE